MKKHTIIGMAGHIDHGKTALIRALTGIQTDQHKEEQERGITIDIGFAYWKENITIIDVPGHEKFVKNMVAGVNTVDLFLLVIAADDGIMPQTIEHLEILKFFGVKDGIVALNKADLADDEWLMLVEDEIEQFLSKHGYNNIPIVPVSAVKNTGIDALRDALTHKIERLENTFIDRPFRLNVDRSFSAKGFGSIVTGTILSSEIHTGETVMILPGQKSAKIRGLQVHQQATETASCGQRCAVNLAGISKDELPRGTVLAAENALLPTKELLAELRSTDQIKIKIKRYSGVRVHIGTQEIFGKIYWFDDKQILNQNEVYHARITLNTPGVAAPGDPVLIRSLSPVSTVAGGKILMIDAPGVQTLRKEWTGIFETWASGDLISKIKFLFDFARFSTVTIRQIKQRLFENDRVCTDAVNMLLKQKYLVEFEFRNEQHLISQVKMDEAIDLIVTTLDKEFAKSHLTGGCNFQQIKNILKKLQISEPFLERSLRKAVASGRLELNGSEYSTAAQAKNDARSEFRNRIEEIYQKQGFDAPDLAGLSDQLKIDLKTVKSITLALSKENQLVSIGGQFYLHRTIFEALVSFLKQHFSKVRTIDVAQLRDFTGVSRKYVIPLLEYLDSNDWTKREGDLRVAGSKLT